MADAQRLQLAHSSIQLKAAAAAALKVVLAALLQEGRNRENAASRIQHLVSKGVCMESLLTP
jgi:hypothetical protein